MNNYFKNYCDKCGGHVSPRGASYCRGKGMPKLCWKHQQEFRKGTLVSKGI